MAELSGSSIKRRVKFSDPPVSDQVEIPRQFLQGQKTTTPSASRLLTRLETVKAIPPFPLTSTASGQIYFLLKGNKMIIKTMINVVVSGYFGHFKGRFFSSSLLRNTFFNRVEEILIYKV